MNSNSKVNTCGFHTFCTYTYNLSIKERQKIERKNPGDFKEIKR